MNEKLPYEEELSKQLSDLQLPDENISWDDMRRRLDDDDDDGAIITPFRKGCLGYVSLLFSLLILAIWLMVKPTHWTWNKNEKRIVSSGQINTNQTDDSIAGISIKKLRKNKEPALIPVNPIKEHGGSTGGSTKKIDKDLSRPNDKTTLPGKSDSKTNATIKKYPGKASYHTNIFPAKASPGYLNHNRDISNKPKNTAEDLKSMVSDNADTADVLEKNIENINKIKEPTNINRNDIIDSMTKKNADSVKLIKKTKNDTNQIAKVNNQDNSVKKAIYFAAGLALNQQLPVSGQKLVPYNSVGRRGSFADYIPSLYFRMHKDQKWFIQSEFRYGAPQLTPEILYLQKKVVDSATNSTSSTSTRLKKTYYHQLPLSFNYFLLPGFSVGTGLIWNKFSSEVSEQETHKINNITLIDSLENSIIFHSKKSDSNFVKSYIQAIVETQYKWERWSFGARYSFGLQPYLKFHLPGGDQREEKNSSLQIFIRYNLWQSLKK